MLWAKRAVTVSSCVLICLAAFSRAGGAEPTVQQPNLVFREIKITGDEFVVLQNAGTAAITHLSNYWLGYSSSAAPEATAPPGQQLPDVALMPGQALLLTGGGTVAVCDAAVVANLSPTLSNSEGALMLWRQTDDTFARLVDPQALARWDKSTSKTAVPAGEIDLAAETDHYANPVWYFDTANGWALADMANCTLSVYDAADTNGSSTAVVSWPPSSANPPAVIESLADGAANATGPVLPAADVGLQPPQITELLPNPAGTGTDSTDEFIELYNANAAPFDLAGFTLETGLKTKHKYTFPQGVIVPPKSFGAFYSADTNLSLSNTSGQADLLDPFGTLLSQTDPYGSAKDGKAWTLADGVWYWSDQLTPAAANVVRQAGAATGASGKTTQTTGSVKGVSSTAGSTAQTSSSFADDTAAPAPIHTAALAAVALAAVAYGLYEYRHDIANKVHQLRANRSARRSGRQ